jgi:four helix bundle protein
MEGKITSFTKLKAWQKAHALALLTYQATESFPKTEVFGLVNQMRRAVVSVESNIAEGFSRQTSTDKAHFYNIALGSCTETQSQLLCYRSEPYLLRFAY